MAGEVAESGSEATFFIPDGTASTLEKILDDLNAFAHCIYDGMVADVVFATPEGTDCIADARISPLCAQHIGKETQSPMIPLIDITGGYWSKYFGYEPLFIDRASLADYKKVLVTILEPEDYAILFPEEPEPPQPIKGWRRLFGRLTAE